ncbi:deleted in azoospermia protein 3-like isoform X1 [Clytia hemisphaerica]|uniref:RRM domain-containing protein n=1 Tax=Clytia hemisphaerica TaxID=252671 RepID=A0A7M5WSL8_9CNID|eukprot:TCONS_00013253-protein
MVAQNSGKAKLESSSPAMTAEHTTLTRMNSLNKNFKNLTIQPPRNDDMKCQCAHYFNTECMTDPLLSSENIPSTVKSVSPDSSCTFGTHYPNRIFVGHLPGKANATDLADFFRTYGTVLEGKVVLDSFGRSRRFGFVTFATQDDVQKVLSKCPFFFKGKKINVGPAVKKMFGAEFSPPTSPLGGGGAQTTETGSELSSSEVEDKESSGSTIVTVPPVNEPKDPTSPNTPKSGNVWLKVNAKPKISPKKETHTTKPMYHPSHHFVYPTVTSTPPVQSHISPYQQGGAGNMQFYYPPVYTTNQPFNYQGPYYTQSPVPYYENGQAYFLKPVTNYGAPQTMYLPGSLTVA